MRGGSEVSRVYTCSIRRHGRREPPFILFCFTCQTCVAATSSRIIKQYWIYGSNILPFRFEPNLHLKIMNNNQIFMINRYFYVSGIAKSYFILTLRYSNELYNHVIIYFWCSNGSEERFLKQNLAPFTISTQWITWPFWKINGCY